MSRVTTLLGASALAVSVCLLSGCAGLYRNSANKSSLVEFLYPETTGYIETPRIPHLELPLRVGIAFTPAQQFGVGGFTESEKSALARKVAGEFSGLDFVGSIEVIPSDYLRQRGGFANLDQLRQLFAVDVIVLLSYDQSIFVDEGLASLTYWTIVGAYIVPGEKNDTQTLIDAAVYDIASRSLLFRAPGTSVVKSSSTLVANPEQLRADSIEGFAEASAHLTANLSAELDRFKQRVKEAPQQYQVTLREGYTGSGSGGALLVLAVLALGGLIVRRECPGAA